MKQDTPRDFFNQRYGPGVVEATVRAKRRADLEGVGTAGEVARSFAGLEARGLVTEGG